MKLKDVVFRKMNILYVVMLLLIFVATISVYEDYSYKRAYIEGETAGMYLAVTYDTEHEVKPKGVSEMTRIKTAARILKVDSSLTGEQCIVGESAKGLKDGDKAVLSFSDKQITCEVYKHIDTEDIYPYEAYVSQEKYDSIDLKGYTYLYKVENYETFKKLYWGKEDVILPLSTSDAFIAVFSMYYSTIFTLNTLAVVLALLIVIVYINTLNFIKANSKKTKKNEKDHKALTAAISTLITLGIGVCIILLIAIIVPLVI
jgi:hypothetical protein